MKTVLITGSGRGIGSAIKAKYEKEGYRVFAPPRSTLALEDRTSIKAYLDNLDCKIDVLINNAGINPINIIENTTVEDLDATLQVNLVAPFLLIQGFAAKFNAEAACCHVVNISSIWSGVSKTGRVAYSMAKTGLIGLTRTAAVEFASRKILVNSIAPGFTLTDLTKQNNSYEEIKKLESQIPLGRMAEPEEIALAVFMIGSENNTYMTGQTIFIDGGFTCL